MNKVTVRAPVRADLAGGTLDLWPLYLFHPGSRTVNVAISFFAESEVCDTGTGGIEIHLTDQQYRQHYESLQEMSNDPKAALLHRALEHFKLTGIRITTRTDAPRGSGLGGSSALAITLVRALSELAQNPIDGEDLIHLVRDLETRLLGVPAGIQDYYPPVFGGLGSLHLNPGRPARHPLQISVHDLASHMLLHYTGVAHFSGTNNWELYKRQVEKKKKVDRGLATIADISIEMERALDAGNFEAAGVALGKEWEARKALIDGISTPEIDAAISAATEAGAWAGKVCGAGGGGCIVFLFPPDRREAITRALSTVPGRVLDVVPVAHGMTVEHDAGAHTTPIVRAPRLRRGDDALEQLYVSGGQGHYKPFVLAEGIVTHTEGRSGTHHSTTRSYIAPIAPADGRVMWHQASLVDAEKLELRAVPDPDRRMQIDITPEALMANAAQSQDGFKQFLEQNERLSIFHNPAFALFSDPSETRDAFLPRGLEEANRRVEEEQERLESTFRRRIDQLREKSEREQREIDKNQEHSRSEAPEVNVAWGQALYNITSGRPAPVASTEPGLSSSVRETDYLENIAQIQRAWDRELQGLREELQAKARSIEEISITPTSRNIEVTKYLILWAPNLG
ncbi:MAG: GHMP family kinase ATP-binding protein [Thermoanaerobaculia bacterium]